MEMQRRNSGDNHWNSQFNRGFFMESPPNSKLFCNDSSASLMQPLSALSSGGGGGGDASIVGDGGLGYILHTVTKFDTLAGVAIKYGVEVADVKKMNGLTTDIQMFSRKVLHIPLPGRHPPSPIMSNGYNFQGPKKPDMTPPNRRRSALFESIKSLQSSSSSPQTVSPSMDALRDYYGLKPTNENGIISISGLGAYQKPDFLNSEDEPKQPQSSHSPLGLHRKCKSLANDMSEKGVAINGNGPVAHRKKPDMDTWYDKLMGRRLSEIDLRNQTPEMLLKPDTTNTTGAFSAAAGKGLALRPTAASRTANDSDGLQNLPPGDSLICDTSNGVKKSCSSPSFYDSYNNSNSNSNNGNGTSISSIWPTSMLNLTVELQALSTAAITRPIFDGLPKPMSGRKNKAAID